MKIVRERYAVTREIEGKQEIFCGLARNYEFKDVDNIGNTAIKTYLSEKKALSSYLSSWYNAKPEDVKIIKVIESIIEVNQCK